MFKLVTEDNIIDRMFSDIYAHDDEFNIDLHISRGRKKGGGKNFWVYGDIIRYAQMAGEIGRAPHPKIPYGAHILTEANKWLEKNRKKLESWHQAKGKVQ